VTNRAGGRVVPTVGRPCLGLVNGTAWRQAKEQGREFVTVATWYASTKPRYEAIKVSTPSEADARYAIVGVWLPLHFPFKIAEVSATLVHEEEDHNADVI
jgi:hypothetical protein